MSVQSYQQTDTAALDGAIVACSGATLNSSTAAQQCIPGGAAGSTFYALGIPAGSTRAIAFLESPANYPGQTSWASGNWTLRLNVNSAQGNLVLDRWFVCRLNSAGVSQATVLDSGAGLNVTLQTGLVLVNTQAGSAQASTGVGDRWYIVIIVKNNAVTTKTVTLKFDQLIDTPLGIVSFNLQRIRQARQAKSPPATVIRGRTRRPWNRPSTGQTANPIAQRIRVIRAIRNRPFPPAKAHRTFWKTGLVYTPKVIARKPARGWIQRPPPKPGKAKRRPKPGIIQAAQRLRARKVQRARSGQLPIRPARRLRLPLKYQGLTAIAWILRHKKNHAGQIPFGAWRSGRSRRRLVRAEQIIKRPRRTSGWKNRAPVPSAARKRRWRIIPKTGPVPIWRKARGRVESQPRPYWTPTRATRRRVPGSGQVGAASWVRKLRKARQQPFPPRPARKRRGKLAMVGQTAARKRIRMQSRLPAALTLWRGRVRRKLILAALWVKRWRVKRSPQPAPKAGKSRRQRMCRPASFQAARPRKAARVRVVLPKAKIRRLKVPGLGQAVLPGTGSVMRHRTARQPWFPVGIIRGRKRNCVRLLPTLSNSGQVIAGPYWVPAAMIYTAGAVAGDIVPEG